MTTCQPLVSTMFCFEQISAGQPLAASLNNQATPSQRDRFHIGMSTFRVYWCESTGIIANRGATSHERRALGQGPQTPLNSPRARA
jgi:hypothetical protein